MSYGNEFSIRINTNTKNMKHLITVILSFLLLASCTITTSRPMTEKETRQFNEVKQLAMEVECLLDGITTLEAYEAVELLYQSSQLKYTFSQDIDSVAQISCRQLQERVEALQQKIYQTVLKHLPNMHVNVASNGDCLLKGKTTYPVYLQRGEKLRVNISSRQAMTVKVYNYDAKSCIKAQSETTKFNYSLNIEHTAIYLVEINPYSGSQYASLRIDYTPKSVERLTPTTINEREVEAQPDDFRVRTVKGIKMKNIFEEPRKFTLRGQLKAMFSGAYRGVVGVEIPTGTTDILYSMRISTNEADRSSDGNFSKEANSSYHKIKMLGLPVYESTRSVGIIKTILGDYTPLREEDAYINMFVFRSSSQAKKFQDDKPTSQLSYDINYSIMGMQSSTGRIPVKGLKNIYLGFENERARYNNYVWVEVIAVQPNTEYYKTEYYIN